MFISISMNQMPAHKNDFEDWDRDDWIPLSIPYIPSFLAIIFVLFCLILTGAVLIFRSKIRFGKRFVDTSIIQIGSKPAYTRIVEQ